MARAVFVAIDPGKHPMDPLRLGAQLARALDAPVVLVTVFPHHPLVEGPEDDMQRASRAAAQRDLLELGRTLEGVELADALAITGTSAARSLQKISEDGDAAVIVVGSTTRGALGRLMPGSVAERLVSGAACPIAVAPHGYGDGDRDRLGLVGVAYDGSDESAEALDAARMLARRSGAGLRVITVVQRLAFGAVPVSLKTPAESVNQALERQLRDAHEAAVAAGAGPVAVEGVVREGDAAQVLTEESGDLDLLVAGSRGYGPLGAVLLGGTTHTLLRSAQCPLLITPRGRGLEVADP